MNFHGDLRCLAKASLLDTFCEDSCSKQKAWIWVLLGSECHEKALQPSEFRVGLTSSHVRLGDSLYHKKALAKGGGAAELRPWGPDLASGKSMSARVICSGFVFVFFALGWLLG